MTEPLNWTAFQTLFVDYEGHSILSKEFLPTVVDIWSSDLNLPIPIHFNSLIPKVLMFNLAISFLTTSSLPWLVDLTFQDPVECYSFQHWTFLSPAGTATTDWHFCFGSAASFFLYLLVIAPCSSPVSYWVHSNLGSSSSGVWYHTFSTFSFCPWDSPGKNAEVGWHFLFQLTMFC